MNLSVFRVTVREIRRAALVVAVGLGAFFYLVLLSSSTFVSDAASVGFFRQPPRAVEAFLGGSANFLDPSGWLVIGMMHPVVLALQTAGALMVAAGAVATELERGTLELVLSRPLPRSAFLTAKMTASLATVTVVHAGGLGGVLVARVSVSGVDKIALGDVLAAFFGSWTLFAAFAMVGVFLSAGSSLRGRAIGAAVGVVVASFFANFIALLFDEVRELRFVTPFHYFRPAEIVEGRALGDLAVPAGLVVAFGVLAVWRFARRDLTR